MLKNNKGFTVIELIMSFLFASILAITLFSVVVTYKDKQMDSTIEAELLSFKSHLVIDIQEDIQLKGLKKIELCPKRDNNGNVIPNAFISRCVIISYNDDTTKEFSISQDLKIDKITDKEGHESQFSYYVPYVLYGGIRYDIPDAPSVYIEDDYILETRGPDDGLESGTTLYKIHFNLKHADLDTDIDISIVANGTQKISTGASGSYNNYNIGEAVMVQLNSEYQRQFRVIQKSNTFTSTVLLLYDDAYDSSLVLPSTDFNLLQNHASKYSLSKIRNSVHSIEVNWSNAEEVRLITTEELSRITQSCPQYRGVNSPDLSLSSAPNWLFGEGANKKSFWTMSEKLVTGNDNGKKVWYVDANSKTLSGAYVNATYAIKPVIVIQKKYITTIR